MQARPLIHPPRIRKPLWGLCLVLLVGGCERLTDPSAGPRPADLWRLAALGDVEGVRALCGSGIDLDRLDPIFSMSALELAACHGQPEVTSILVEAGADPDRRNGSQGTPMLAAAFYGRARCLEILLEAGADPYLADQSGVSPISVATDRRLELARVIARYLQMDMDDQQVLAGRSACRDLLGPYHPVPAPPSPDPPPADGDALFTAIVVGDESTLRGLLEAGTDLDVRDQFGSPPLLVAAFLGRSGALQLLLEAGADPRTPGSDGMTPYTALQVPWSEVKPLVDAFAIPLDRGTFQRGRIECRMKLSEVLE